MARFIALPNYATGGNIFIDPDKVSGITDLVLTQPSKLEGGAPQYVVVGALVVCDGQPFQVNAPCEDVAATVTEYRSKPFGFDLGRPAN